MPIPDVRNDWSPQRVSDYNRSLSLPIRWAHILFAAAIPPLLPIIHWATTPRRITWIPYVAIGLLLVIVLLPLDEPVSRALRSIPLGSDIQRELEAAQQYGQLFSSILIAAVIWLQDPARRRRLADWATAFIVAGILAAVLKMFLGRPRPLLDEPDVFLGPLGAYPLGPDIGIRYPWEAWAGISSKLWSMPSSHTAYMAILAVFLAFTYPRLRYLAFAMVALVGFARMQTGAHYLTDVIAGAALGLAVAHSAMRFQWGQRLLDACARWRARQTPQPPIEPRFSPPAKPSHSNTEAPQTALTAAASTGRG